MVTAGPLTVIAVQGLHACSLGMTPSAKRFLRSNLSGNVAGLHVLVSAPWEASMRLARRPSCHAAAMDLGSLCSSVCTLHR